MKNRQTKLGELKKCIKERHHLKAVSIKMFFKEVIYTKLIILQALSSLVGRSKVEGL